MQVRAPSNASKSINGLHPGALNRPTLQIWPRRQRRQHFWLGQSRGRCRAQVAAAATGNGKPAQNGKPSAGKGFRNANFPVDDEGRTYHLGTKMGEVAPRILSVGSTKRARLLTQLLQPPRSSQELFTTESSRGFVTVTGEFQGVPVSIVSTHMGMPNMDFVVRECHAVVPGPMAIVRLGTCGAVQLPARLGDFVVASRGSVSITRVPDYFTTLKREPTEADLVGSAKGAYHINLPVLPDPDLSALLAARLRAFPGSSRVHEGLNASADSFYSSQGRKGMFEDHNESLLQDLATRYPHVLSLEMETFHLFDLARCSLGTIHAAAVAIVLAERHTNQFLDPSEARNLELQAGTACLQTLVDWGGASRQPLEPAVQVYPVH